MPPNSPVKLTLPEVLSVIELLPKVLAAPLIEIAVVLRFSPLSVNTFLLSNLNLTEFLLAVILALSRLILLLSEI